MHDVEISEDKNEAISEADLLEFVRRTLIADLPAETIPIINSRIDAIETMLDAAQGVGAALPVSQGACKA